MPHDPPVPACLATADQRPITTPRAWSMQRREILEHFRDQVYGRPPAAPDAVEATVVDSAALDGRAIRRLVTLRLAFGPRNFELPCTVFLPAAAEAPPPVVLFINNREDDPPDPARPGLGEFWPTESILDRGYAAAILKTRHLVDDDAERWRTGGLIAAAEGPTPTPRPPDAGKAIAAWAWGTQRVMDYLQTVADLDAHRVALVGHSRGGKTALWAAANDERFSIVVSNMSGCTGAALARHAHGESIRRINTRFPHWFCDHYQRFNDRDTQLPFDQHQLLACIAPRGLYVASAVEDLHADPRGEFLALAHASPVYGLWGHPRVDPAAMPAVGEALHAGPLAYHLAPGGHTLDRWAWSRFLNFFARCWNR